MHESVLKVYRSFTKPPLHSTTEVSSLWSGSTTARAVTGNMIAIGFEFLQTLHIFRIYPPTYSESILPHLIFQEIVPLRKRKREKFFGIVNFLYLH